MTLTGRSTITASRQQPSNSLTHGPVIFPSSSRTVLATSVLVVIFNIGSKPISDRVPLQEKHIDAFYLVLPLQKPPIDSHALNAELVKPSTTKGESETKVRECCPVARAPKISCAVRSLVCMMSECIGVTKNSCAKKPTTVTKVLALNFTIHLLLGFSSTSLADEAQPHARYHPLR